MTHVSRETLTVSLGDRSYAIHIGPGLLAEAGALCAPLLRRPRAAIVADEAAAALHLPALTAGLAAAGIDAGAPILVRPGEASKDWATLGRVTEALLEAKIERDDVVIAFGGGVVGDLAGFAAAILRRGVRFIQIPTTLLAQVDSSVGGKTGVNAPQGKNLIGAFHQPALVLADLDVTTLPPREYLSGYAEVVKYGLLGDAAFFAWLEANGAAARDGDIAARLYAVKTSCAAKAAIVARDEREAGDRALLNLGHTFGHALEAATGYSDRLLHGEGVAIGMTLAFEVSARMGLCSQEEPSRVRAHMAAMGLKTQLTDIPGDLPDADGLIALMGQDKKVKDGRLTFILVRGIGDAFVTQDADMDAVRAVLTGAVDTP